MAGFIDGQEPEPEPDADQEAEAGSEMTAGQANALRSAQDYLRFTAFSRTGLTDQLEFEGVGSHGVCRWWRRVRCRWVGVGW